MNSHYDIDPSSPSYGRFRREHPELLIGRPHEAIPEATIEWGIRTGLNYAFPQVREYMYSIITELIDRFDLDGVELDFMRHPAFFRTEEAFQNGYLMTDLVKAVRARMIEVGSSRGKSIRLAVRVPPTLADSRRVGIDVATWIEENLVDVVVVGGGFIPFDTPIGEFVSAARGSDIQIYGCIEALRHMDESYIRALASLIWRDGASGIYLYNFFTMPPDWNKRVLNYIADPKSLAKMDKRYELGTTGPFFPIGGHSAAFRFASPSAQLPLILHKTIANNGPILRFNIADDLETSSSDGSLATCTLSLKFERLGQGHRLKVLLNGESLSWNSNRISLDGWRQWIRSPTAERTITPSYPVEIQHPGACVEYDVGCPPLKQGQNQLEIQLASNKPEENPSISLKGVDINITYQSSSDP